MPSYLISTNFIKQTNMSEKFYISETMAIQLLSKGQTNLASTGNGSIFSLAPTVSTTSSNTIQELVKPTRKSDDVIRRGPYVDKNASKNITALLGKTAYLNCRVKNLGNTTVSLDFSKSLVFKYLL